jgi:hypothetical protein
MIGDRILSGYPIINGKYVNTGGEVKVGMLPRNEIKVRFELGLLADLIVLKQWPAIIDDKAKVFEGQDTKFDNETAYNFASNFLIGDALKKYLSECTYSSTCRPDRRFPYSKLRITGDYDMPTEVKISRDKAPAFLARLQGQKRTAYLAYDVTLGQPKWDYEIDAPTLTSVWTNPRLYVDADMQQPLYVFNVAPSQKNAEQTAANTAPTSEQSSVEKTGQATLAKVPNFLLLYKYAPNAISEDDLLQREKQQIGQDQWHHKYPKQAGSYVFAFTEAEVKDREVNFAATDLCRFTSSASPP